MLCRISDIRIVAVLGAIAVLAVWAIANTDHVEVDWTADTTTAPLIAVIGALGFIIGLLIWVVRVIRPQQVEKPEYQIHEVHRTEVV